MFGPIAELEPAGRERFNVNPHAAVVKHVYD